MSKMLMTLAAAALVLAGCAASDNDDADVTFAQQMVPHHEQAVEMADLALDPQRDASAPVRTLATQIKKAQGPEIRQMKDWLDEWDAEDESNDPMEGMDHGSGHGDHGDQGSGHMMEGMMSDADMSRLEAARGTAFDRLWLSMMIEHHEGAITMSRTEVKDGENDDAKQLARDIIATQQREITRMKQLQR
ncbi:MAG: DUF305 domain-containing protein [Aeromicrobium erythreum]